MNSFEDFMSLFIEDTGAFLYFISIFVIYQAAFLMAFGQRTRSSQEYAATRYSMSLAVIAVAWLALMAGALYSITADTVLPPIERAVNVVVLLWIGWAFLTAETDAKYDSHLPRIPIAATLFTVIALIYTLTIWDNTTDFNQQSVALIWTLASLLIVMMTTGLMLTEYKESFDIPLKLLFEFIVFTGHLYIVGLILNDEITGNFAGAIRWSFIVAGGLLLVIIYRMVMEQMLSAVDQVATYAEQVSRPMQAISASQQVATQNGQNNEVTQLGDKVKSVTAGISSLGGRNQSMELLKALGIMLNNPDTDLLPRQIVFAVGQSLKADVVAVLVSDQPQWAQIMAAYNSIEDSRIDGMLLSLSDQPTVMNALATNRKVHLNLEEHDSELRDFYKRIDVNSIGPAYLQPLAREGKVVGLLIVAFPFTHLNLRPDDLRLLESIAPIAARLLVISRSAVQQRAEAEANAIQAIVDNEVGEIAEETRRQKEALQANLEQAHIQIRELNLFVHELEDDLDKERERVQELLGDSADAMSITQRISTISLEREQLKSERENLVNALLEAKASLISATTNDEVQVYQTMIDDLKDEYDDLVSQKESLEKQLQAIRTATDSGAASAQLTELLEDLTREKAQIAEDRDTLKSQLETTEEQLEELGIEGGMVGIAQRIAQLTEERAYYKAQAEKATQERERLLNERHKLEDNLATETTRSAKITALENEVSRLVQDREALIKSRDSLKIEREAFITERDTWRSERARMIADNDSMSMELEETIEMLNQSNRERQELASRLNEINAKYDSLRAKFTRAENERDALLARIDGDRERLKEVGAEGVGALTQIVDEITKEKAMLEERLLEAQEEVRNMKWKSVQIGSDGTTPLSEAKSIDISTLNSLSQELMTPLSAISHYSDMMLSESVGVLSSLQQQFMVRMQSNIDRLNHLIGDLVQASSLMDGGDVDLQPVSLNIIDVIDDAITDSRYKFSEKGIVLDLDLQHDLPEIEADSHAIKQVVRHLIDNAYLVSPNDSAVRVVAKYSPNGKNQVQLSISDKGGGVPEANYDMVFSRMNRSDNNLIKGVGHSGVELSLVKGLIEAHNGKIWLETDDGVGTTFNLTLPLKYEE